MNKHALGGVALAAIGGVAILSLVSDETPKDEIEWTAPTKEIMREEQNTHTEVSAETIRTRTTPYPEIRPGYTGDKDCKDFSTHREAQIFFEDAGMGDPHDLDRDGDGYACETLP